MSDPEIDQISKDKYRYYAGLVWNDFYTLLSVLDESLDKRELDKCWNDFYFAFWKDDTERYCFIDDLIMVYLEKIPDDERDIMEMDISLPPETIDEGSEAPGLSDAVRNKLKTFIAVIVKEKLEKDYQNIVEEIKDKLLDIESAVIPVENSSSFSNFWEEFAFQVQKGKEELYHACERSLRQLSRIHFERLSSKEIRILWLGTTHGIEWRGDGYLPDEGWMIDILEETLFRRLENEAMNWPLSLF